MKTSIASLKIDDLVVGAIEFPSDIEGLRFTLRVGDEVREGTFTKGYVNTTIPHPKPASTFTIGPGNTYHQAWLAALAGHQIRMPDWPADLSWVFHREQQELLRVYGETHEDWIRTGTIVLPAGSHQLSDKWEVLPIIDREKPIV